MLKETSLYKSYGFWMPSCHYHLNYLSIYNHSFINFPFNRSFVNRIVVNSDKINKIPNNYMSIQVDWEYLEPQHT